MQPNFPIYIVSKGRWKKRLTAKSLERIKTPYYMVVEKSEYDLYADYVPKSQLLILDPKYLDGYETCDDLGSTKSKGPGAARNFAWDHSISQGFTWHWVMDDNIEAFHRLNRNTKIEVGDGTIFRCAEDFVLRYENIGISGLNYSSFCPACSAFPAFTLNSRIYSCLLIRNDIPYRWRGRYNEDTDLSLRALKDGWCTVQFNAFLCAKITTQRMGGGNTKDFYREEGTLAKSQMLVNLHPDVSRLVQKYNRWHHHVDYSPFKNTKLIRKPNVILKQKVNEYGMNLIDRSNDETFRGSP